MAQIVNLRTIRDPRGDLTVIERDLPFEIKRIYYLYNLREEASRGGHRHHKTIQALICLNGNCVVSVDSGNSKTDYTLDAPTKCLILNPEDWHTIHSFETNSIILVLASEYYDPSDYIDEEYC